MSAHHPDAPHTTVSPVTPVQHRGETKSCCVLINIPALPGAPGCFNMGQSLHATCHIFPRVLGVAGSASANRFLSKDTFLVFEKQANIGENCIGYSIESFIVPLDPALHSVCWCPVITLLLFLLGFFQFFLVFQNPLERVWRIDLIAPATLVLRPGLNHHHGAVTIRQRADHVPQVPVQSPELESGLDV